MTVSSQEMIECMVYFMIDCGGGGGEDIFMEHAGNISNIFYNTQKSLFKVHYILFISFIHSFILLEGYSRYQNL